MELPVARSNPPSINPMKLPLRCSLAPLLLLLTACAAPIPDVGGMIAATTSPELLPTAEVEPEVSALAHGSVHFYHIQPESRGGSAYKLVYYLNHPIDTVWTALSDFESDLYASDPQLEEQRVVSRDNQGVIVEEVYSISPVKRPARVRYRLDPLHSRIDFSVTNPSELNQAFNYGHIQLSPHNSGTKVAQVGYFKWPGQGLWAYTIGPKGLRGFHQQRVEWQAQSIDRLAAVRSTPSDSTALVAAAPPSPLASDGALPDLGDYYALVIGIDSYRELPPLESARHDARAIATLLERHYGFQVTLLLDATRADILKSIATLRRELGDNDNLLIYFAGHGWLDKAADQGYWLPVNAAKSDTVEWISNATLSDQLRAMYAKHVMVIADSCYSGKLTRSLVGARPAGPDLIRRLAKKRARIVLTSGGLEPVLDAGGSDGHSVFASALIGALEENQGILDGVGVFARVRQKVGWNADQTPEYAPIHKTGHDGGDFLFVPKSSLAQ